MVGVITQQTQAWVCACKEASWALFSFLLLDQVLASDTRQHHSFAQLLSGFLLNVLVSAEKLFIIVSVTVRVFLYLYLLSLVHFV